MSSQVTGSKAAITLVAMGGALMAFIDISIVNVALSDMRASFGTPLDQIGWVSTGYMMANIVVIPMTGWFQRRFGFRRYFSLSVLVFTIASALCGLAWNLPSLVIFRVLQGLGGGGLAPTEQSIFADTFPPAQRAKAFAFYGVTVIVAPAIGPLLGGWLTDSFSWHWIFLINLPVGVLALTLIWFLVDEPQAVKDDTEQFRRNFVPDWLGFVLVAATFGCLQVVLDRFQEDDGFSSNLIVAFFIVFVSSAIALVLWELQHPQPVFDVRLFKVGSFGAANLVMLLVGFTLFSTTQLIPQFAQNLLQYDALAAGQTLALGGLAAAAMMPFAGIAASKLPPALLVAFGLTCTGLALIHTGTLNGQIGFWDLSLTRVYQSFCLPFLFVSLTTAAYVGIPPDRNNDASAIINLSRNLGGSIGVAAATTELAWRIQFHHERLGEQVSTVTQRGHDLTRNGLAAAQAVVNGQAQVMSYLDIFYIFGIGALCVVPVAFFLKTPAPGEAHGH